MKKLFWNILAGTPILFSFLLGCLLIVGWKTFGSWDEMMKHDPKEVSDLLQASAIVMYWLTWPCLLLSIIPILVKKSFIGFQKYFYIWVLINILLWVAIHIHPAIVLKFWLFD